LLVEAALLFHFPSPAEKIAGRKTSVRLLIAARCGRLDCSGLARHVVCTACHWRSGGILFVEHVAALGLKRHFEERAVKNRAPPLSLG